MNVSNVRSAIAYLNLVMVECRGQFYDDEIKAMKSTLESLNKLVK